MIRKHRLGVLGVIAGGALGLALTFGGSTTGQAVEMWRKVGQTIYPVPTTLSVNLSGGTVTLGTVTLGSATQATTTVEAFTQGGTAVSTSTLGTTFGALSESQLILSSLITLTPNILSATSTLPATSTMTSLLPNTGDTRSWTLLNGTSTAARNVGIAAGTGINLTSNALDNTQIQPDGSARMTCVRLADTDVHCLLDILVEAD